jgi:hypothetical protein
MEQAGLAAIAQLTELEHWADTLYPGILNRPPVTPDKWWGSPFQVRHDYVKSFIPDNEFSIRQVIN